MFRGLSGIFSQRREHGGHKDGKPGRKECPMGVNHHSGHASITDNYRSSLRRANRTGRGTNERRILSRHSGPSAGHNWARLEGSFADSEIAHNFSQRYVPYTHSRPPQIKALNEYLEFGASEWGLSVKS